MRDLLVLVLIMSLLLCGTAFANEKDIIAKIGGRVITKADFDLFVSDYPEQQKAALMMDKKKQREILEVIVQGIVIGNLAREKGFDKKEGIKEKLEFITNDFLIKEFIKQEVVEKLDTSDKELEHFYNINKERFTKPERIKAKHIFVKTGKGIKESVKIKAFQTAEDALKRLKAGEDFSKVASDVSDDSLTKARGGEIGFIERGRLWPEIEKVAYSLNPGEMSGIIESAQGYHIILVEDKMASELQPYDKIKTEVRQKFIELKLREYLSKELKDVQAEILIK